MGVRKKKIKIRKEFLAIGFILLLMLLTLWGWYLKTNKIEVFEVGDPNDRPKLQTSLTGAIRGNEGSQTVSPQDYMGDQPKQPSGLVSDESESGFPAGNKKSLAEELEIININTAGIDELVTLNGIGEVKARQIVAYREQNGAFQTIEQIMDVKGIGQATFDKIKDRITVTSEEP